jgi:hypothetical protein
MKRIALIISAIVMAFGATACASDDSDVVDHNITKAAKNFEVQRRVAVINGVTDKVELQVEGRCNVDPKTGRIFITCKVAEGSGNDAYLRHTVYTSDNVFVTVEQGEPIKTSAYHYRFTYKPQSIIPDVDFRGKTDELPSKQD